MNDLYRPVETASLVGDVDHPIGECPQKIAFAELKDFYRVYLGCIGCCAVQVIQHELNEKEWIEDQGRRNFAVMKMYSFYLGEIESIMPVLKHHSAKPQEVRKGLSRRLIHTRDLMMVVIDFTDGPWSEPEPMQNHVHEQITFVAEGELIFFCEGEKEERLGAGDMFSVPSNKKHGIQLLSPTARLIDTFNPIRQEFL